MLDNVNGMHYINVTCYVSINIATFDSNQWLEIRNKHAVLGSRSSTACRNYILHRSSLDIVYDKPMITHITGKYGIILILTIIP